MTPPAILCPVEAMSECRVEQFISFGAVLDVPQEPDGGITLEDCERAAAKLGRGDWAGAGILLHTGFPGPVRQRPRFVFAHRTLLLRPGYGGWQAKSEVVGIDATSAQFWGRIPDTSCGAQRCSALKFSWLRN
ncbi:MAG: hypothetical protein U0401_17770 [Anaerolineae bacterium]